MALLRARDSKSETANGARQLSLPKEINTPQRPWLKPHTGLHDAHVIREIKPSPVLECVESGLEPECCTELIKQPVTTTDMDIVTLNNHVHLYVYVAQDKSSDDPILMAVAQ